MKKTITFLFTLVLVFSCSSNSESNENSNNVNPPMIDVEDNTYQSITICNQLWTKTNLNVSKYSDGTPIPQITDPTQWENLTTGAWCYYNNDPSNEAIYGKLYNWYAVAGIHNAASATNPTLRKKLAPTGWHIPSDTEWSFLINCLDPNANGGDNFPNIAGGKIKSTGILLWLNPNTDATNESGFEGLPGGFRYDISIGSFSGIGTHGGWWSSSEKNSTSAWSRNVIYNNSRADRDYLTKNYGCSIRCVKD